MTIWLVYQYHSVMLLTSCKHNCTTAPTDVSHVLRPLAASLPSPPRQKPATPVSQRVHVLLVGRADRLASLDIFEPRPHVCSAPVG